MNAVAFAKDRQADNCSRDIDAGVRRTFEGLLNAVFGGLLLWTIVALAGTALR